ncbi:MAG TPA: EamA family transporter [Bacillota bacterium]|jgi:drug/metabolite transporter (DMT)-like permease
MRRTTVGRGELWAAAAALCYTLSNLFLRAAALHVGQVVATLLQVLPLWTLSVLVLAAGRRRRSQFLAGTPGFVGWLPLGLAVLSGLVVYAVGNPVFVEAIKRGGVVIAVPVVQTSVVWGALIGAFVLDEALSRRLGLGLAVFVLGLGSLSWGQVLAVGLGSGWITAIPLAALSALTWGISSVVTRKALRAGLDRFSALAVSTSVGVLTLSGYLAVTGSLGQYGAIEARDVWFLLGAGLMNAGAQVCLVTALSSTRVSTVTAINASSLGLVTIGAHVVFGEALNPPIILAVILIFAGIILSQGRGGKMTGGTSGRGRATERPTGRETR